MRNLLIFYGAGTVGALANSVLVWLCGHYGINQSLGVAIAPSLTTYWLYPRLVWGGMWGLLFLLPLSRGNLYWRGVVLSLVPSLAQLFIFFPYYSHQGIAGLELGVLTPLLVLFYNAVWGLCAAVAIRLA